MENLQKIDIDQINEKDQINGKDQDKSEKIVINVVRDNFSSFEIQKLTKCIDEIRKNNSNRHVTCNDDRTTINEKIIIYIQNGTLSIDELKKVTQCLRDIEQNKPTRHINIFMNVPDKTVKQMQEVNDSIVPGFPIKRVIEFKKGD